MNKNLYQREIELLPQVKNFFNDLSHRIVVFFNSYQWQEIVFGLKITLIIISFLLVLAIAIVLIKKIIISQFKKSLSEESKLIFGSKKKIIEKKWEKIEKRIKSRVEANYKLAILEADKLFDKTVKEMGYGVEKKLTNIEEIKKAGKIKNNIIEDKKIKISKEQAEKAVGEYKKGLKELGVL